MLMTATDIPVIFCFCIFVLGETVADQQQWNFHAKKRAAMKKVRRCFQNLCFVKAKLVTYFYETLQGGQLSGDIKRGFLTEGLWRYSRHPNFFCEQLIWWTVYSFG